MFEFHLMRTALGLIQLGIVAVLLHRDIGYLLRFGVLMFASAAMNLAPAHPTDDTWKYFVQVPAYAAILAMTIDATLEFFAFLRRRTFIEERSALLVFASIVGLIPVWVLWTWPGENWYQNAMLIRQFVLIWLASGFVVSWCWLRAVRPIHASVHICDQGEFWGIWLVSAAALSSTTKYGVLWKFAQWQGNETLWRVTSDAVLLAQICICCGFLFNCWNWKSDDVAPVESPDPQAPAPYQQRRLLHL
jgi:hypothetical protein